jgi:small ligand-binding sensory domain FIST
MVYSGQEFGETVRRGFVDWQDADEDLREHYRDLVALNDDLEALAPGASFEPVAYDCESKGVTAYARESEAGERVVVVLNFGPATETVALPEETVEPTDLVTGADVDADGAKGVSVDHVVVMRADT